MMTIKPSKSRARSSSISKLKYLITGGAGFIGRKLSEFLLSKGHEIFALDLKCPEGQSREGLRFITADLTDPESLQAAISGMEIHGVFHLAAQPSVQVSWQNPLLTYKVNAMGTATLIEVLKKFSLPPKTLYISSGEVYGNTSASVLKESTPLSPCNPYGLSKVFGEELFRKFYPNFCIARPFSATGLGQSEIYVVPNFCRQVAEMKKKAAPPVLHVGNVDIQRNILSFDDVLEAYSRLMEQGENGGIYNVASDKPVLIREILEMLKVISGIDFRLQVDPDRVRPVESKIASIDISRMQKLGWTIKTDLQETVRKMYESYL